MTGRSFYENIEIVPPGGVIRVRNGGRIGRTQFFTLGELSDPQQAESLARQKPSELVDCAEELLLHSVKSQLCADTAVGALCSGGVDSSLVMAMAARCRDNLTVFHADVVGPLSECAAAERLARHLKLDFQRVAVYDQDFIDTMPDVVEHFGFPFTYLSNAVPFLMVSRLVRSRGVKAVLCGEGSDECYLGYPWLVPNVRGAIRRLPKVALRKFSELVRRTERWLRGKGPQSEISLEDRQLVQGLQTQFEDEIGPASYSESLAAPPGGVRDSSSLTDSGRLSYILRILLHRNDSLGMAASIEARFPFLDTKLLKLAVNLPYRAKVRFSPFVFDREHLFYRDKWIVRQIADRYLPADLSQRKKQGFPTNAFQRLRVRPRYFEDSFVADLFRLDRVRMHHLLNRASHALKLRLLQLNVWGKVCLCAESKSDVVKQLQANATMLSSFTGGVRYALPPTPAPGRHELPSPRAACRKAS
jgi:asparagine synthase (glutamine-hydrolysing)